MTITSNRAVIWALRPKNTEFQVVLATNKCFVTESPQEGVRRQDQLERFSVK
jgi:hypothetical protein